MPGSGRAELDAAGLDDPGLRAGYAACRALHAAHGRTYFLATRLLPAGRRPAVHALYGFARFADEIVDDLSDGRSATDRAAGIDALGRALDAALAGAEPDAGTAAGPVLLALVDTARRYAIDPVHFRDFLASMRMDTEVTEYAAYDDLARYMHGSAAVIGLQMVPILGTVVPREEAEPHAAALGVAFQLTNFLRDVGDDLDRGRVYLPADELAAFGVDRDLLEWCRRRRAHDPRVRAAIAHLVARTRAVYRRAAPGIGMLEPVSRACIGAAATLYGGILDRVADAGYDAVLHRRVRVGTARRAAVAVPGLARAVAARTPVRAAGVDGRVRTPSPARDA
ncbi:MAG: phytoene/squalene synthase family protein [Pseudonocardia sp.]|uniref:phytoene/squalene synthase family protein n=1 Tax=unclassified Pseudonocardia TaxID=2619320 RepID=UPI000868DFAD|nr:MULTISPECIES: phytoene/squalene synthase family protein [unclassified Pseudonocardia]MBN9107754.1 phytoene/squalene synthase family protein [Pseudonocardia sp.]ODU04972.1 MAG: phytoene synthase [Pseudonocardia sp. SCN 72-51]ODV07537.1 MAG: phytoene synthase [Pseudonocardia sp. SCN 73-27]